MYPRNASGVGRGTATPARGTAKIDHNSMCIYGVLLVLAGFVRASNSILYMYVYRNTRSIYLIKYGAKLGFSYGARIKNKYITVY